MNKGERIRKYRELKGATMEELAKACGTTKQTIFKYENNIVTNIPSDRIELIARFLGISEAYIMGWDDDSTYPANIEKIERRLFPVVGEIACGSPKYAEQNVSTYVNISKEINADFCLIAKGDSMVNARIYNGDIVFIRKQEIVENGEIAAVIIGNEATLKRFYYYREQSLLILRAENPEYKDQVYSGEDLKNVKVIGKAVAFQSNII